MVLMIREGIVGLDVDVVSWTVVRPANRQYSMRMLEPVLYLVICFGNVMDRLLRGSIACLSSFPDQWKKIGDKRSDFENKRLVFKKRDNGFFVRIVRTMSPLPFVVGQQWFRVRTKAENRS